MNYWADKFRGIEETEKNGKIGIVAANNHYAGFGAATANMFRVITGLNSVEWGVRKEIDYVPERLFSMGTGVRKSKQRTLLDYPSE